MKKVRGGLLLGLGLLLLAAGLVLKLVLVPDQARFPDDVDETRTYSGTVDLLNRQALATGDIQNLFLQGIPATIERRVTTEEVKGNKALVHDVSQLKGPDGTTLVSSDDFYTIDRKTMEAVPNFTSNNQVNPAQGLVIGFPIGTDQKNYTGWSDDPNQTVELKFVAKEKVNGRTALLFEASSGPQKIVHPGTLENFPAEVPKALIAQAAPLLGLAPEVIGQLSTFLPLLPDQLPLTYTYEFEAKYWIDPDTGVLLNTEKHDLRKVLLDTEKLGLAGVPPVPITAVYDLEYSTTEASKADAIDDAKNYTNLLRLGNWVPWGFIGLGGLLMLLGLMRSMRRGKDTMPTVSRPGVDIMSDESRRTNPGDH